MEQRAAAAAENGEPVISLTMAAVEKARLAMQREGLIEFALRVSVVGGGCSGYQYAINFDDAVRPDDHVSEQHGLRIVVDPTSAQHLRGTCIDYVTGLHGAGFRFSNPNAARTCGCGSSFSV